MAPHIEKIADNFVLAEGPHWDEATQSLYFVDMRGHTVNRYLPETKKFTNANTGAYLSIIIPVKDHSNTFIITGESELRVITWDGESDSISMVKKIETTNKGFYFNDGKCDLTGRLWIGTLKIKEDGTVDEEKCAIYAIQKEQSKEVFDKISLSNGLAFNVELKKFYYIDSHKGTVDQFDLDIEQGTIKNRQIIFTLSKHDIPGLPDGMAIDTDGNLWVAVFNGGRVIKIDPRKPETLLYTLLMPTKQITSVAFGGQNLDELYVTSACIKFGTSEGSPPADSGAIYRVTGLGARGTPGENFIL